MKKYIVIFFTLALIVLAIVYLPYIKELNINPFQKKSIIEISTESIKNIDIAQYNSALYTYKTIFPYDFTIGDPQWGSILYKNSKFLTDEDKINISFYYQCKNIGVDLAKLNYFFTITAKAVAGLNLKVYLQDPIIESDVSNKILTLKTPEFEILNIEIIDSPTEENYPDAEITPGQWRDLILILLPLMEDQIKVRGIIEAAEESGISFITTMFNSFGWDKIIFK